VIPGRGPLKLESPCVPGAAPLEMTRVWQEGKKVFVKGRPAAGRLQLGGSASVRNVALGSQQGPWLGSSEPLYLSTCQYTRSYFREWLPSVFRRLSPPVGPLGLLRLFIWSMKCSFDSWWVFFPLLGLEVGGGVSGTDALEDSPGYKEELT